MTARYPLVLNGTTVQELQSGDTLTGYAQTGATNTFTGAQIGSVTTLTDGATITPDFSANNFFTVTLGGNRTLANPTNITAGTSGVIFVNQDATGSRTLAYGTYWKFPSGIAPTLTTTANAVDILAFVVKPSPHLSSNT